jgi:uncharacterized membrane protein
MNTKMLLAALGGAVAYFILGWLIYGLLLMGFFESNSVDYPGLMYETPNLLLIFIANLSSALLFAYIFDHWANIRTFSGGFMGGLIIGILFAISFDLMSLATMNLMNTTAVIVDIIVGTIMTGIVGGVIGFILGTGKKES